MQERVIPGYKNGTQGQIYCSGATGTKLTSLMMGRFVNPFGELQHMKKSNPECLARKGRAIGM